MNRFFVFIFLAIFLATSQAEAKFQCPQALQRFGKILISKSTWADFFIPYSRSKAHQIGAVKIFDPAVPRTALERAELVIKYAEAATRPRGASMRRRFVDDLAELEQLTEQIRQMGRYEDQRAADPKSVKEIRSQFNPDEALGLVLEAFRNAKMDDRQPNRESTAPKNLEEITAQHIFLVFYLDEASIEIGLSHYEYRTWSPYWAWLGRSAGWLVTASTTGAVTAVLIVYLSGYTSPVELQAADAKRFAYHSTMEGAFLNYDPRLGAAKLPERLDSFRAAYVALQTTWADPEREARDFFVWLDGQITLQRLNLSDAQRSNDLEEVILSLDRVYFIYTGIREILNHPEAENIRRRTEKILETYDPGGHIRSAIDSGRLNEIIEPSHRSIYSSPLRSTDPLAP